MEKLKKWQKAKLRDELRGLEIAILGIAIMVCNFFKIVPSNFESSILLYMVTCIIAYGAIIGTGMLVGGTLYFLEVRDTNYKKIFEKTR